MWYYFKSTRTIEGARHERHSVEVVKVFSHCDCDYDRALKAESWDEAVNAYDGDVPAGLDARRFEDCTKDGIR